MYNHKVSGRKKMTTWNQTISMKRQKMFSHTVGFQQTETTVCKLGKAIWKTKRNVLCRKIEIQLGNPKRNINSSTINGNWKTRAVIYACASRHSKNLFGRKIANQHL